MTRAKLLLVVGVAMAAMAAAGQMSDTPQKPKPSNASQSTPAATDRGQEVFKQNCYRCHQEPQGFPASISGAVAKHMRVRAGLSDEDYKALMKFLNP